MEHAAPRRPASNPFPEADGSGGPASPTRRPVRPVILCGGAGARLWPESRGARAKQFLPLHGHDSLFLQTLDRTAAPGFAVPVVVCGLAHVEAIAAQANGRRLTLLVEPLPRNTAGAIGLAVASAKPDDLLLVMPSDHVIKNLPSFHAAVERAARLAEDDWLVTFGVPPERPETGFGYIANGAPLGSAGYAVAQFVEKPPLDEARAMVSTGRHSWNAGIFLFRAGRMRDAMRRHCPDIIAGAERALALGKRTKGRLDADARAFAAVPSDSIDYAIFEKDSRVAVVPVAMQWSDLGSWNSVHALADGKDENGNVVRGDVLLHDCCGNLVRAGDKRVSLIGIENLAVVVDGDDILIMPLARSQDVRSAAIAREASVSAVMLETAKARRSRGVRGGRPTGQRREAIGAGPCETRQAPVVGDRPPPRPASPRPAGPNAVPSGGVQNAG